MYRIFNSYHPLSGVLYFCVVLLFPMVYMHPALLVLSAAAATAYALFLLGWNRMWKRLVFGLLVLFALTLINVLFNHRGATVLFYLGDNPLTLESALYGLFSALMIYGVMMWFICFQEIIQTDKFLFLFGRLSPSAAVIVTMTLRFVPLMWERYRRIAAAQRCLIPAKTGWRSRMKQAGQELSALIGQSLEGAVITADSMKARGYGKRRRTCFSVFRFTIADGIYCTFLLIGSMAIIALLLHGSSVVYFPRFTAAWGTGTFLICSLYAVIGFSPMIIEVVEWLRWNCTR